MYSYPVNIGLSIVIQHLPLYCKLVGFSNFLGFFWAICTASGGVIEEDGAGRTTFCVFDVSSEADLEKYVDLFVKLMRRYKYVLGGGEPVAQKWAMLLGKYLNIFCKCNGLHLFDVQSF